MQIKIKKSMTAPFLVLMICILLGLLQYLNINDIAQKNNIYVAIIIMQVIIFIIPGIIYCKLRGKKFAPELKLKPFTPNKLWFTVCSFIVLISGSALIKVGLYTLGYYSTQYTMYEQYVPTSMRGFGDLVYILIAVALLPAITEEFVFRGIVLGEYRSMGCKKYIAATISALLFSLVHLNIFQLPVFFFGGIIFAFVTLITDSLLCAMLIHFLNNCFSLLFESQLLNLISQTDSIIFVLFILTIVFLIFLILTLQSTERIFYLKGIRGEAAPLMKGQRRKKKSSGFKFDINAEALTSPVLILCIVVFVIIILVVK
ncbi:MAG: CPBP family intramembrane metalloprotease [Clostridia bacterium]|nr:CPBP family intramembrane metalloprotease [Clostridia bacterium]